MMMRMMRMMLFQVMVMSSSILLLLSRNGRMVVVVSGFVIPSSLSSSRITTTRFRNGSHLYNDDSSSSSSGTGGTLKREGWGQWALDVALESPLWKNVLVPQARANIVKTAEANGIPWKACLLWLQQQDGPWQQQQQQQNDLDNSSSSSIASSSSVVVTEVPEYYQRPFHAYEEGNMSWLAAMEQELASRAIGAKNFPAYGYNGEDAFRQAFDITLEDQCGASVVSSSSSSPNNNNNNAITIVDLGCGTGTSTRRLAANFPQASQIIGIDLSPYMIGVGQRLLELTPTHLEPNNNNNNIDNNNGSSSKEQQQWVTTIVKDERVELRVGDATDTKLEEESVDVVHLGLVIHELPIAVSIDIVKEAYRILKPNGGQLWISEMDFESPAFRKLRNNPFLFSMIRSTEPYLDEYADGCEQIRQHIRSQFQTLTIAAATGRHYAMVATKQQPSSSSQQQCHYQDKRFLSDGTWAVADTHLKTWESKKE